LTRKRQRILLIVGGLLTSIALGVVLVVVFRNPLLNSALVRKEISAVLREKLGRDVALSGAMRIDEWPRVELDVGRGLIDNPAGFNGPPLAQWDLIQMRVHYSTAYKAEPQLYGVVIHGLKIALRIDGTGRDNFSDLGSRDPMPPKVPLNLPRVEIRDAEVRFTDGRESTEPTFVARSITLQTGKVERGVGPVEGWRWRISGVDLRAQPLNLDTVALRLASLSVDASVPAARIPSATLHLGPVRLRLSDLVVSFSDGRPPQAAGRFALDPVPLAAMIEAVGQKPPFARRSPWFQLRGLSGSLRQTEEGLLVDNLRLNIDDVRLTGSVSVGRNIRFSLRGNRLDLDRYIEALAGSSSTAPIGGFLGKTLLDLPLEGTVRLDSAVSGGLRMREITLEVTDRGH
jgi:hypothetical protein